MTKVPEKFTDELFSIFHLLADGIEFLDDDGITICITDLRKSKPDPDLTFQNKKYKRIQEIPKFTGSRMNNLINAKERLKELLKPYQSG